jgi:hypothetical protein
MPIGGAQFVQIRWRATRRKSVPQGQALIDKQMFFPDYQLFVKRKLPALRLTQG